MMRTLGVEDDSKGRFVRVTEDNLLDLLVQHTGPEDVPAFSEEYLDGFALNVQDMLFYMDEGEEVFQFIVEWIPDWLAYLRGEHLPEPQPGWLSIDDVHRIKDISKRTIKEYCGDKGPLKAEKCKGGIWYVKPDETFDYWITKIPGYGALYRRLLLIRKIMDDPSYELPDVSTLYEYVEDYENEHVKRYGMYENYAVEKFMARALGRAEPLDLFGWWEALDDLIREAENQRENEYFGKN